MKTKLRLISCLPQLFLEEKIASHHSQIQERNDVRSADKEKTLLFNDNNNDTKSAFTLVSDYINFPPRQSTRNYTKRVLYPGQIVYNSVFLSKVDTKAPKVG